MQRPSTPEEAERLYEAAVAINGPFTRGRPLNIKRHDGYHIETQDGRRVLDLHGHILAHYMGNRAIHDRVLEVLRETGVGILAPNMTHPEIDLAKVRLAEMIDEEFGGGPWEVDLQSSGTRSNEDALSVGRGVLGAEQQLAVLREGYHGSGGMRGIVGHSSWNSRGTLRLGVPMTLLDFVHTDKGRDYEGDFERFLDCNLGADGRPHLLAEWGVQGVAGFEVVEPTSLKAMTVATHERGGLAQADIVQTAPLRTGQGMLAPYGIVDKNDPRTIPDFVTGGKGMGMVGQPLAFVAYRKASLAGVDPKHFAKSYDTNGRSIPAAAAFNAGYDSMMDPAFQAMARENMAYWRAGLEGIQQRMSSLVRRVTGLGYMSALELDDSARVQKFLQVGAAKTMVTSGVGGLRGNKLRLGMKLDAPRTIVDEALQRVEDTLKEAA